MTPREPCRIRIWPKLEIGKTVVVRDLTCDQARDLLKDAKQDERYIREQLKSCKCKVGA